ncbi:MAG: DNA-binding response regulator [Peptococcaceae bacterium]|nr:MAG: DNA-binding response regulator [Peptococcaceae bacterium]
MKVMLVDDHPLFLEGLQYLLETRGIEVTGTALNGGQAIDRARILKPDVILMDIAMPGGSGLDAIRPIKAAMPEVKIVMLTTFDDDENLFEAVKRGASGYLLKNLKAEELFAMLTALEKGEAPLSPGLAARLLKEFARQAAEKEPEGSTGREMAAGREEPAGKLTQRQTTVLDLVAKGMSYKEAGTALGLSERTIKYHMERILELLHLENKAQVIAYKARESVERE